MHKHFFKHILEKHHSKPIGDMMVPDVHTRSDSMAPQGCPPWNRYLRDTWTPSDARWVFRHLFLTSLCPYLWLWCGTFHQSISLMMEYVHASLSTRQGSSPCAVQAPHLCGFVSNRLSTEHKMERLWSWLFKLCSINIKKFNLNLPQIKVFFLWMY